MRKGAKVAIVGGVVAVMVGGAGYGAYNFVSALSESGTTAAKQTGPPSADEVEETTEKFFAAWEKGDPTTASQLKQMMRLTATQGTAKDVMSPLSGDIGAKTGSAEVDGRAAADSWFTGFRGDVAAAAMSEGGGPGGEAAGPIVVDVLGASG